MKLPVLPTFYYLDHFTEMLAFVRKTYGAILGDDHHAFFRTFEGLTKDAQCLFIRMINRRGVIFNRSLFKYPEILEIDRAVSELIACGYARNLRESDYTGFVGCLPRAILVTGAQAAGRSDIRKSWSKAKLIAYYLAHVPFSVAAEHCGTRSFIALDNARPVEFLLYLYFGKTEEDLKNFALRDLGILRTNRETSFSSRFADGDEARACFHYSQLLDRLELGDEDTHRTAVADILSGPGAPTDYAADLRSRAACLVGQFFEKRGNADLARMLYRTSTLPDCRERLVRLLYASCDKVGAEELLRQMIDDPGSDDEFTFASDFYARKYNGRRTSLCTDLLRSGTSVVVDDTFRGNPEAGVAGAMRRQGYRVFFAENTLWQCLFGLLFWEELFESGQLHSGFDWMPHCLKDRSFARLFAGEIERKIEALRSGKALPLLLKTVSAKWGKPNGVFAWDHVQMEALRALLEGTPLESLATIARLMCQDYRAMRDGFPDLMLIKDGKVSFVEIKAEGDVIRRNQLTRLRQLRDAGIIADIARVDYRFDPAQDYVVVDIETTGGWASGDRITEIGAVKIRNHEVVAEWHSLINPQRRIPASITQLTGITNEMVSDAPVFAEVATSFMEFMGDSIFVAHNVNFDYGFIAYEYERLDRRFRFPKLCTVAGMRRRYPGHRSYSLGRLCALYEICLDNHHRALCDARAAGQLLNLINKKRDEAFLVDNGVAA